MNQLPTTTPIKPANIRLGLMLGAALLLGGISLVVNLGNRPAEIQGSLGSAALLPPTGANSPAGTLSTQTPPGDTASAVPPVTTSSSSAAMETPTSAITIPAGQAPATGRPNSTVKATPARTSPNAGVAAVPAAAGKGTPAAGASKVNPSRAGGAGAPAQSTETADTGPVIPDVFTPAAGDTTVTAQGLPSPDGSSSQASGLSVSLQPRTSPPALTVPSVPLSAVPRQIQVAPAVQMSLQSPPAPTVMPAAPVRVQQLQPLPAPVSVTAAPVVLTRPAQVSLAPSAAPVVLTAQVPAPATANTNGLSVTGTDGQTSTPLALTGIALGDIPTAVLDTPAGQLLAVVGDTIDVAGVPYVVKTIRNTRVILNHGNTTITLTETP